jgi:transposase-like protein
VSKDLDHSAICEAYLSGKSLRQVAEDNGTYAVRVMLILQQHGIPRRRKGRPNSEVPLADIIADYGAGLSLHEVAAKHGIGHEQVSYRLRNAGVERRPASGAGRAFYIWQRRRQEIAVRYALGQSIAEVALAMGCSAGIVTGLLAKR